MISTQSPPRDLTIPTTGGLLLRGWHWTRPNPRGVVVVAHGFGEHGGCYRHVAEALGPTVEVDFVAPDQRGHGRSPGARGVVRRYADLVDDLRAAVEWAVNERPGLPVYVLGHSNGGQLALRLALEGGAGESGLVLSNPALKVAADVPWYKLASGRFLHRFAPAVTLSGKLSADLLTRDPAMRREHETDPLRHSRMSAPFYFGMAEGGEAVAESAGSIKAPVLMLLGGADPVIDLKTARQCYEKLGGPDKSLIVYPEMLHEPLNELGREQVFADIETWLRPRIG